MDADISSRRRGRTNKRLETWGEAIKKGQLQEEFDKFDCSMLPKLSSKDLAS